MTDPTDALIDAALARQRAQLARDLDDWADAQAAGDAPAQYVAGLRHAAVRVRDGRTVDVPR